jgi:hypothetical protein
MFQLDASSFSVLVCSRFTGLSRYRPGGSVVLPETESTAFVGTAVSLIPLLFLNPKTSRVILHMMFAVKLQSPFSANDIPTMRSATNGGISSASTTPNSHAQQHLHSQNASLGRIPLSAMSDRLSREMTSSESASLSDAQNGGYQLIQSALQASAATFSPSMTQGMSQAQSPM